MENQPQGQYRKGDYQAELRKLAEQVYDQASAAGTSDEGITIIYEALRQETLKSWQRGRDQGRRKAAVSPKQS